MCPMCERRAQLVLQQQAVVESIAASKGSGSSQAGGKSSLFRNPFKTCKDLSHQCCSPLCESQRTSIASVRRSSVRPTHSPDHSGEFIPHNLHDDLYRVSESPLSTESVHSKENLPPAGKGLESPPAPPVEVEGKRKRRGLLTRLKLLTIGASSQEPEKGGQRESSSTDSSFTACGKAVMSVVDEVDDEENPVREGARGVKSSSNASNGTLTLFAAETSLDTISEASLDVTETNVSETTMISMMNLNGSFSSPYGSYHGSTLKSSTYDDDASSFAIVPRTSMNSSFVQDWASDASGLSDRFGELDIGYLSLEESGEGPDIDDTVSISSSQCDDLDLHTHPQDDTVSESDLDEDYSIGTDSQEWCTETDDSASLMQRSIGHSSKNHMHLHLPDLQTTPPHNLTPPPHHLHLPELQTTPPHDLTSPLSQRSTLTSHKSSPLREDSTHNEPDEGELAEGVQSPDLKVSPLEIKASLPARENITEYLCTRCGRKERKGDHSDHQQATTKKVTRKENPMSAYFHTFKDGSDQAVMAAKVVVLLGKYGNRKGLRVAGLAPGPKEFHNEVNLSPNELDRLRSMICPNNDAVTSFQNDVARMMLDGVDVPDLNMDVEQFIAGYMQLNSPFYIDLIEDFFKSVCIDCFGHMDEVQGAGHQRPAYTVLKPRRGPRSAVRNTGKR